MNKNILYLIICFLAISFCAQSQSFNNQFVNSQSKTYALLDLGFGAKLLHLNTEGANTVVKKEEVKKSPRSLEEILSKSENKKAEEIKNVVNATKYHLVVGCFSNINNAQRLVSKLNDKGHSTKIIGQNNRGLHMVALESYAIKDDARRDQKALTTEGVSSWIKSNK
tara:strand:+ start:528 stop:1028 length:501 start_codon:yes stop_codon:yes gene_type:complete